jgi:hypothetical protein
MIYRYIGDNYNYYSDPRTSEFIQYPNETMKLLGGDCEDLTILMESLLESIGIKTYFVFTEDHAYLLACGIDVNKLQVEILNSSIVSEDEKINLYHETVSIPSNSAMYYGGNGDSTDYQIKLLYNLDSNIPINVNIVNSKIALNQWTNGDSYIYYPSCSKEDLYEWSNECQIDKIGGLLIINNNNESAKVNLKIDIEYNLITQKLDLSNFSTKYYKIDNEKCISLEATAGKYGYPGMNIELKGNNTAIDPLTKERYNLV